MRNEKNYGGKVIPLFRTQNHQSSKKTEEKQLEELAKIMDAEKFAEKRSLSTNKSLNGRTVAQVVVALGLFNVGAFTGYMIRDIESAENQTYNQAICDSVTGSYLRKFNDNCNKKNYSEGTVLANIRDEWSKVLDEYSCEPQEWNWDCSPETPSDSENSIYIVKTRPK